MHTLDDICRKLHKHKEADSLYPHSLKVLIREVDQGLEINLLFVEKISVFLQPQAIEELHHLGIWLGFRLRGYHCREKMDSYLMVHTQEGSSHIHQEVTMINRVHI